MFGKLHGLRQLEEIQRGLGLNMVDETTKIRSRYKTYKREEIDAAFEHVRIYTPKERIDLEWYSYIQWPKDQTLLSCFESTRMMLEQRLDAIWNCGDRDEESIKHVLYGVGAILAERKWNEMEDYKCRDWPKYDKAVRSWGFVEQMLEHWGLENFEKIFYCTKFGQAYGPPLPLYFSHEIFSDEYKAIKEQGN
tara:strand:- start:5933 stop:6511 length:579 start_codon:yes stop_codon:yes gene_type:complete